MSSTVRELFAPLNGKSYASRELAEQAISDQFASLRGEFGPDYSLYQLLKWSYQRGWIKQVKGKYLISTRVAKQLAAV